MAPGLFWLQQQFLAVVPQFLKWNTFNPPFFPSSFLLPLSPAEGFFSFFSRTFTVSLCPLHPPPQVCFSLLSCDFAVKMSNSAGILAAASTLHKEVFYSERAALCCVCMRSAQTVHVEQILYVRRWRSLQPMEAASVSL